MAGGNFSMIQAFVMLNQPFFLLFLCGKLYYPAIKIQSNFISQELTTKKDNFPGLYDQISGRLGDL
jgi:hypothetical protein